MKIIIWGTGYIAKDILKHGINAEIIGFVETQRSKTKYDGLPVFDISEIPKEYDYIIVANMYSEEIFKICQNLQLDFQKIVFIKRGDYVAFNSDKRLRNILGERNYTQYAAEFGKWENTFFEDDMVKYSSMNSRREFEIKKSHLYPIVGDKYGMNSGMDEYFWQDLWAAKHIIATGIKEHFDIGSRVDGFIAHLLAADIKVNMIDIRPFPGDADNLFTIVDDATMLNNFEDDSITSLSALCSLEHFGLGRFGDPIDPEACFKCFEQIQKKMKKGGRLYIAVPVGNARVEFNAHRIFCANSIVESMNTLHLVEFSVICNKKIEYNADIHKYDNCNDTYVVGLFCFEK